MLMNSLLIFIGLFLLFAIGFNGGIGEPFVTYSAVCAGLLMVIAGTLGAAAKSRKIIVVVATAALVCYLPVLWQRFNLTFFVDWVGVFLDCLYILAMVAMIISNKPNNQIKQTQ